MRTRPGGWELPISEDQLNRLTREMTEAHRVTLPALQAGAIDLTTRIRDEARLHARSETRTHARDDLRNGAADERPVGHRDVRQGPDATGAAEQGPLPRRRFLLGAGGAGAAFLLAACSGDPGSSSSASASSTSSPAAAPPPLPVEEPSNYSGDLRIVALATALENQSIAVYRAALTAARAGRLGSVPASVGTFMTTAMDQHADHAKAWNAVLTGAGKPAITNVPLSNEQRITDTVSRATDPAAVARLALQLEDQAAQTYFFATSNVKSAAGVNTAATIAPVEAMHAAVLRFLLGQYPVPDTFLPAVRAADLDLLTV